MRRVLLILAAILSFGSVILGIAIAAGGDLWGWGVSLLAVIFGSYLLSWSGDASRLALLHRRALRVGLIEGFRRVRGDETVRRIWEGKAKPKEVEDEDDSEGSSFNFLGNYWSVEEKFEESLSRVARKEAQAFEAVGRDGAILWIEGKPASKAIDCYVWETF